MNADYEDPLGDVLRRVGSWTRRNVPTILGNVPTIIGWMLIALGMLMVFVPLAVGQGVITIAGIMIVSGAHIIAAGRIAAAIRERKE